MPDKEVCDQVKRSSITGKCLGVQQHGEYLRARVGITATDGKKLMIQLGTYRPEHEERAGTAYAQFKAGHEVFQKEVKEIIGESVIFNGSRWLVESFNVPPVKDEEWALKPANSSKRSRNASHDDVSRGLPTGKKKARFDAWRSSEDKKLRNWKQARD